MAYRIRQLTPPKDLPQLVKDFEGSKIPKHKLVDFFQSLILCQLIWDMPPPYPDIAQTLIRNKLCFLPYAINDNSQDNQSNNIAHTIG